MMTEKELIQAALESIDDALLARGNQDRMLFYLGKAWAFLAATMDEEGET